MSTAATTVRRRAHVGARPISLRRVLVNRAWWTLCSLGLVLLAVPVVWILIAVVGKAVSVFHWGVLTHTTSGVGGYGLANAWSGTLVLAVGVAIIAGLIGVSGGVYLAEFGGSGIFSTMLRSASEVLAGIPSIVFGYVGYLTLVIGLGWNLSLLPGVIVLSMLVVPYIAKATELALNQVPSAYREGGEALGMSKPYLLRKVVFRSAVPGVLTGLIIALAISVGETAPLLYTAGFTNAYPSLSLIGTKQNSHPIGYLTYAAYQFIEDPSPVIRDLAYDASMLLIVLVLLLIIASRVIVRLSQKFAPNRAVANLSRQDRRKMRALSKGPATPDSTPAAAS
jgi:phosphate transport system permease protein